MKIFSNVAGAALLAASFVIGAIGSPAATAAEPGAQTVARPASGTPDGQPAGVPPPDGYVIGPEDVLGVVFWREADMSADVIVRPDGMITLPLINEVRAAGRTPQDLREELTSAAAKYIADPSVTIVVKAINSLTVFITGQVMKPGEYPLTSPTTVVQLLAMAGGLQEFANGKKIMIMRTEGDRQVAHRFNYKDVLDGKNLAQNIQLRPGDTVLVP
jgi:polysaccharide export outer membrane protein